jgi:uncharacterized membrane protein YsdA (DUF1294 family)
MSSLCLVSVACFGIYKIDKKVTKEDSWYTKEEKFWFGTIGYGVSIFIGVCVAASYPILIPLSIPPLLLKRRWAR